MCDRKAIIKEGYIEEYIIANCMEQVIGFCNILAMVNQSRLDHGLVYIGISCLIGVFSRMKPVITNIRKISQTSDMNKACKIARENNQNSN